MLDWVLERVLAWVLALVLGSTACAGGHAGPIASSRADARSLPRASTAFFYGPLVPRELVERYDRVVVEADHAVLPKPIAQRAELFAYVSLGEVHPSRAFRGDLPEGVVLGRNGAWGSEIVDAASAAYRGFALDRVIEPLWVKGYRGFFFDTLDSYQLVVKETSSRAAQVDGLARIVEALKARHPDAKILLNRGFELLPRVARHVDGVVAESLLESYSGGTYARVPASSTAWLLTKLREVQSTYGLPVTVIDYVAPEDRARRRETARRIAALGFDPWVASPALDDVGVGRADVVPPED